MTTMRAFLRSFPTLFRVGLAEVVAYRAEFLVWILTTNMPLVMMALWTAVAVDGPVGRFGPGEFVSYYLAMLVVRLLTSSWMVWELTMDVRQGRLAARLLRPVHPLFAYLAEHLAAVPMRVLIAAPLVVALLALGPTPAIAAHPERLALLVPALVGAWLIYFFNNAIIGALALYVDSALAVFELWLGIHFLLSGYLIPLELLPAWLADLARVLPFRYILGFPVEIVVGLLDPQQALRELAVQWTYVATFLAATLLVWRAGMRRFVAFGG